MRGKLDLISGKDVGLFIFNVHKKGVYWFEKFISIIVNGGIEFLIFVFIDFLIC